MDSSRLSLNQITTERWSVAQAAEACAAEGIGWIGLWRHKVDDVGLAEAARSIRGAGLKVSSLCRGGGFPGATAAARRLRIDDNFRAIDEAVALGTDVLVLVCGGLAGQSIEAARAAVESGIAAIMPTAKAAGIRLAIEPLHPVFAADRSVVVTLGQANDLAERLGCGVIVDVYHVWWDPDLYQQIHRAAGRIYGFHVSDWGLPITDPLMSRVMMGDGVIPLRRIREAVESAGYDGPVEVEIFNQQIWDRPGYEVLEEVRRTFQSEV